MLRWCVWMVAVAGCFPFAAVAVSAPERPHIVVILADDMGYGDVAALNPTSKIPTPNLDRLAAEGMTFSDAHSPSAVCTPTRYGLLTGRYCWRSPLKRGVLGGYSPPLLEEGRSTIADLLRGVGYRTAAVGKWHLGMALPRKEGAKAGAEATPWFGDPGIDFSGVITDSPIHHGFDRYFGVSASLDMAPYVYVRDDRFTMLPSEQQEAVPFPYFVRQGPRAKDFVIDEVLDRLADEAVAFIREASRGEKPFFLYLPLTAPHKPTQPHPRFRGRTALGEYGDFVAQVDATAGRVLQALQESGVADETLVVYTSDNGSYMRRYDESAEKDHVDDSTQHGFKASSHRANGPLRGTKADIWEAGHRVPFFVRWPGQVEAGSRCETTVCLTDLYATCAEVVDAALSRNMAEDSLSLVPLLRGTATVRGAPVVHHSVNGTFAIRDGRWKLVLGNGSGGREKPKGKPFQKPYQLFDLSTDLGETRDVAAAHPEWVARLEARLDEIQVSGRTVERPAWPDTLIGYTEFRTNLPGGRHANVTTQRACVVGASGRERQVVAESLAKGKPHTWTQFAGWSLDGKLAIIGNGWESPQNAAWEEEHRQFRFSAEGWLYDTCLVDLATGVVENVTAVERASFYNTGVYFWPGENTEQLGFQALIEGKSHPFRMDRDGRNKVDLTTGKDGFAYGFGASPDGKRIAYHKDYQIYIAGADGKNALRVETKNPFNFVPRWSPDGEWLVFLSGEHYDCHPHIVRKDGTDLRPIAHRGAYRGVVTFLDVDDFHGGSSDTPVWSKDGWIYYTARVGESVELSRVSLEGTVEQLTVSKPGVLNYHPTPSPDGRWLAFGSNRSGGREIHLLEPRTREMRQATEVPSGYGAMWPHWQR
jgi:arylsulfatase A